MVVVFNFENAKSLLSGESEMGFIKNSAIKYFRVLIKSGACFLQTFITDGS